MLRVTLPPSNPNLLSGGIGLADLKPLLDAQDRTDQTSDVDVGDDLKPTDGSRVLQFRVEHYGPFLFLFDIPYILC
jgi:hypothetical protein